MWVFYFMQGEEGDSVESLNVFNVSTQYISVRTIMGIHHRVVASALLLTLLRARLVEGVGVDADRSSSNRQRGRCLLQ